MRVGYGYDLHRFDPEPGSYLIKLGGIEIKHNHMVIAHSDGDVLIHALCDALLGAMADGDIGQHFPDTDPRWKDVAGIRLLREVAARVARRNFVIVNLDLTLVCEAPKIGAYRDAMKDALAATLGIPGSAIGIKAKTSEGIGPIGRGEALAAHAVALLKEAGKDRGLID